MQITKTVYDTYQVRYNGKEGERPHILRKLKILHGMGLITKIFGSPSLEESRPFGKTWCQQKTPRKIYRIKAREQDSRITHDESTYIPSTHGDGVESQQQLVPNPKCR